MDTNAEEIPELTVDDLESGIFNLVVAMCQKRQASGSSLEEACETTAQVLDKYALGLRAQVNKDNKE